MAALEKIVQRGVYGALGGLVGASCMTAVRMVAHRAGLIDRQVPQVFLDALTDRSADKSRLQHANHQATAQAMHLAYGIGWGGLYGALFGGARHRVLRYGSAFGLAQWAFGFLALVPALGLAKPAWRASKRENAVNVGAHVLYGVATALLSEELARQPADTRTRAGTGRVG